MKLCKEFSYIHPNTIRYVVENGYETDGASIPRFLWSVVGHPFDVHYLNAAVIHDKLCDLADQSTTRKDRDLKRETADLVFYKACLCSGCNEAKAHQLLVGVRIGALCLPWKRKAIPGTILPKISQARGMPKPAVAEDQLLMLWQETCAITAPKIMSLMTLAVTRGTDPEREMLKEIDAQIVQSGLQTLATTDGSLPGSDETQEDQPR